MLRRFISAAWIGITTERKITNSSNADRTTTIPMNNGSLLDRTWEKSIDPAVKPPTCGRVPNVSLNCGST